MHLDYNEQFCKEAKPISDRQLTGPQLAIANEAVNKAIELQEMISKKHIQPGSDKIGVARALESLEFSEKVIEANSGAKELAFGEAMGKELQFAADPLSPAIGNWTFASLNMVVQQVGSSTQKDTALGLAFPDKSVPEWKVMLDRIAPNSGMLSEFGGDSSPLEMMRPLDTFALEYQPALYANRTQLTAKHIMFDRKRGEASFDQRGVGQLVAYNSVNLVTAALTRKHYLLNQAIFNNGFQYLQQTISSNIPTGNYINMEPMGTLNPDGSVTYATVNPNYTPLIAITNIINNPAFIIYRPYVRGFLCNGADLQAIMNHPNVKAVTNLLAMGQASNVGSKSMEVVMGDLTAELTTYFAPGFEFPLIADDRAWLGQDSAGVADYSSQNFFVPRGKIYVMLDLTAMGGQNGAFHLTYNEVDPNYESPTIGLFTGVFPRNLFNSDTTNRLDIVAALAGAPAVYMPEAQFILQNLYDNV